MRTALFLGAMGIGVFVIVWAILFTIYESRWTRRTRQIAAGGPADRTRNERLSQHVIEPEHPVEEIRPHHPEEGTK